MQLSFLDILQENQVNESTFNVGDTVRVNKDELSEMSKDYFTYYYPHVLKKSGIIKNMHITENGIIQYEVDILGEKHWLYQYELI